MSQGISSELRSKFDHKLDVKNRIAIPSEWRPSEGCCLFLLEAKREGLPMIKALTQEKFADYVNDVEISDLSRKDKDKFIGRLHSVCVETTINGQGKMLIPRKMIDQLALVSSDVKLVGRGKFFEIWEPNLYEEAERLESDSIMKLNDQLGIF